MARSLFDAYLQGEAAAFFPAHPASAEDRRRAVVRAVRPLDPAVADAIERQNARLAPSALRLNHLRALREGAAAVVTGQQVGLFLGPLFTLYKAASAIAWARLLAEESGRQVVPVFWLQTEDHDLPEIACCSLPSGQGEPLELRLPAAAEGRVSIAHQALPQELDGALEILAWELSQLPHGEAFVAQLRRHYRPGVAWADAFAGLLAELFEALVLVDPRDPVLAAAAAPVHRQAMEGADRLAAALLDRCAKLEASGFGVPVHVRAGAPLSFFHPEGADGPRYRLEAAAGGFREVGGDRTHRKASILQALADDSRCCSSSALLRPIVQDSLLPTAAYVGGPGEIAYFAQLSPLYAAFDLPMPLVVPRARFRVIEGRTRRLLDKLGLQPADAAQAEEALLARCADGELPGEEAVAAELLGPFRERLAALESSFGPGLDPSFRRTRVSVERAVSRFAARWEAGRLRRDQGRVDDVRRLRHLLQPCGLPQERVHGLPFYAARYGADAFVDAVLGAVRPLDFSVGELHP